MMRQQMEALPGGLNNPATADVQKMQFTYNPTRRTFNTYIGGVRRAAATIAQDDRQAIQKQQSVSISGPIALAIIRAISQRRIAVPRSFQNREKQGRFIISGGYPYNHQNAIIFHEVFLSSSSAVQAINYLALDDCAPRISYVVSFPSYRIESERLTSCEVY
ncbi:MAG: hypothetical protein GIW98_02545 [Candidatus Eremiobacteraeota bacterium]|nr:hypothetical protein [Candidatus Eremiobacteraeota bacterium]